MRLKIAGVAVSLLVVIPCIVSAQPPKPLLYTAAQAQAGAAIYASSCAACHGAQMEGVSAPALKGPAFGQLAGTQGLTVQSLLEVIANTMPQSDPGSLRPEDNNAVTAYILQHNRFLPGTTALASGAVGVRDAKLAP